MDAAAVSCSLRVRLALAMMASAACKARRWCSAVGSIDVFCALHSRAAVAASSAASQSPSRSRTRARRKEARAPIAASDGEAACGSAELSHSTTASSSEWRHPVTIPRRSSDTARAYRASHVALTFVVRGVEWEREGAGAGSPEPCATPANGERSASVSSVAAHRPVVSAVTGRLLSPLRPGILPSPPTRIASPVLNLTTAFGGHVYVGTPA
mmetsp:Transcript_7438/g.20618  ORF Transcript_7438/g.20618 Transcript_7438/m.20618 type:complete len:212 (-) Transcript_7438:71-706(-)